MSEEPARPDPDALLAQLEAEAAPARARLKIFFGAAPGVGKTYTMLESARRLRGEGVDVVVGVVETHGRRETTGSRTGMVGNLKILIPGPGGFTSVDGSTYYAEHYWKPDTYFDWQDQIWRDPPTGSVEVGPLQSTPPPPPEQKIEPAS